MNPLKPLSLLGCAVLLVLSILLLGCGAKLAPTTETPPTQTFVPGGFATPTVQIRTSTPTPTITAAPIPEPTPTSKPEIPDYNGISAVYDEEDGRYEAPVPGRDFAMAYWNSETNSWVAIEMRGGIPPNPDHINIYLSADAPESPGTLNPNQRFILTGEVQNGRFMIKDVVSGSEFWVDEASAFGPAEEFQPSTQPTPAETPRPPEGQPVFCPAIPEGFWNPYGGVPVARIQENEPFPRPYDYMFGLFGVFNNRGIRNPDGSISVKIRFNISGTGMVEADYIISSNLFLGLIINGENDEWTPIQLSAGQICQGDVVMVTSTTSTEVVDPRVPGPHQLNGPIFVNRFRQ